MKRISSVKKIVILFVLAAFVFSSIAPYQSLVCQSQDMNYIQNPQFESYSGTQFANWNYWPTDTSYYSRVTGMSGYGVKITGDPNNWSPRSVYQEIWNATKGKNYTLSAYVKTTDTDSNGQGGAKITATIKGGVFNNTIYPSSTITTTENWTKISISFTLPVDANYLLIDLTVDGKTFDAIFDDMWLIETKPVSETNYLQNYGFENYAGSNFSNWNYWISDTSYYSRVSGKTGYAAKVSAGAWNAYSVNQEVYGLTALIKYEFSACIKTQETSNDPTQGGANLVVTIKGGSLNNTSYSSPLITNTQDWTRQTVEFVVPSDAQYILVTLNNNAGTFDAVFDDAYLRVADDNSIQNSGLESYSGNTFTNWSYWVNNTSYYSQIIGRTGYAARINAGVWNAYSLNQEIWGLEASGKYEFSAYVKTEETNNDPTEGGANLVVTIKGGALHNTSYSSSMITNTQDWTRQTVEFIMPSDAQYVLVTLNNNAGTFSAAFDDVKFIKSNKNLQAWVTDSLDRVRKNRAPEGNRDVTLFAAKGESESFQMVLWGKRTAVQVSNIALSNFVSGQNTIMADGNTEIYKEQYINVSVSSKSGNSTQEQTGYIPDGLIPAKNYQTGAILNGNLKAFPTNIVYGECQPYWIDIYVPRNAQPGVYQGEYTVTGDNEIQKGNITLVVWDFELPSTQTQKVRFQTWSTRSAQKVTEAAKNRMFVAELDSTTEAGFIAQYGYNISSVPFWSGADASSQYINPPPTLNEVLSAKAQHDSRLPLYCYSADEITGRTEFYDTLKSWARVLHEAGVDNLVTMPPVQELLDDGSGTGRSAVDIWTVLPKQYIDNASIISTARAKGDKIWTYNCLSQDSYSPKWLLDYSVLNYRIHPGFINFSQDVQGFLYWAIDYWSQVADPWTSQYITTDGFVFQGDGILFYPGDVVGMNNSYVPSIRVKAIRDGLEDYELLTVLKNASNSTTAKQYSNVVGGNFNSWSTDKDVLIETRINAGNTAEDYLS